VIAAPGLSPKTSIFVSGSAASRGIDDRLRAYGPMSDRARHPHALVEQFHALCPKWIMVHGLSLLARVVKAV
jgi:hypothetical protein